MSSKTGARLLCEQKKKISLRCPLTIESARLYHNAGDDSYQLRVALEYSDMATEGGTIRSVGLSIRLLDGEDEPIPISGTVEPIGRQIRFENGLGQGEKVEFALALEPQVGEGTKFSAPDVSISQVMGDGGVVNYLRGDFFFPPDSPLPLEKVYEASAIAEIREQFGESARFVPEKLSSVVWRCTCGELCEEEVCTCCRSTRSGIFAYFGDTEAAIHPPFDLKGLLKKCLIIGSTVVGLLVVVLVVVLFAKGCGGKNPEITTVETPGGSRPITSTVPNAPVTGPDTTAGIDADALIAHYLSQNDFANALLIASSLTGAEGEAKAADVCEKAIAYFDERGSVTQAITYAKELQKLRPDYDPTPLYVKAYDRALAEDDLDSAFDYAVLLGDDGRKNAVVDRRLTAMLETGRYAEAVALAKEYRADRTEEIITTAIGYYLGEHLYTEALSIAAESKDAEGLTATVNLDAAHYYIGLAAEQEADPAEKPKAAESYRLAFVYAKASGDTSVFESVCRATPAEVVRTDIPGYFEGLVGAPELLRAALGHTIAQGRFAAMIRSDGAVVYGPGLIYRPQNTVAVSVAVGETHAAVLLGNGKVVELSTKGEEKTVVGSGAIAIAAAGGYTVVLSADGRIRMIGSDGAGAISSKAVAAVTDAVSVSAGERHILVLRRDGSVEAIGDGSLGQCSVSGWTDIVAIAAGAEHSLGLRSDGTVVACGYAQGGRLDVTGWTGVRAIAAGRSSSVALFSDGSVRMVGGTIGVDDPDTAGLMSIVEIAAGEFGMIARSELPDGSSKYYSVGSYAPDLNLLDRGI